MKGGDKRDVSTLGLERTYHLFLSFYDAVVVDDNDPEGLQRIKVKCPAVYADTVTDWISPRSMISSAAAGISILPKIGDNVHLEFQQGNPRYPFWAFALQKSSEVLEASPDKYLIKTPSGVEIQLNGQDDIVSITTSEGVAIQLQGGNYAKLENSNGTGIEIDGSTAKVFNAQGAEVAIDGAKVLVKGSVRSVKDSLDGINDGCAQMLIATPFGTFPPVNVPQFVANKAQDALYLE